MNARWCQLLALVVRLWWHVPHVELQVSNLSEELVLIYIPVYAVATGNVWVGVDEPDAREIATSFDCWTISRVSDELCVVVSYINVSKCLVFRATWGSRETHWMIGRDIL
jgi:hypothetical protein